MRTVRQALGDWGETTVLGSCTCPKCKREKTLVRLPSNFKCADLICDFCGFLAQVKAMNVRNVQVLPKTVLGAAWAPQRDRMNQGIYFPLFLVLKAGIESAIYYLATDFQSPALFRVRKPLSEKSKRAGWQGFVYVLEAIPGGGFIRLR